uniref:Uncharacterized protein n=2 Tax=Setaria TaxID=4554 RepID=K4A3T4_SETIT
MASGIVWHRRDVVLGSWAMTCAVASARTRGRARRCGGDDGVVAPTSARQDNRRDKDPPPRRGWGRGRGPATSRRGLSGDREDQSVGGE